MSYRTRTLLWQRYALVGTLVFQPTAWAELSGGMATDGTMGTAQILSGVSVTVPQSLGTTVGNNLFHSFSEFNIAPGQSVEFTGSNALQNVISRVTGTDRTDIDGTLKSSIANAAFYLINPNGITFGAGAQVDVPGAFHVSTADKIDFPNHSGAFYADSNRASTLSSEAPAAFGFLDTSVTNNGLIDVDGAQLAVKTGQTLDMVAGEIDIKNYANVNAPAGEIRLAALQGSGVVGLQQTADGALPLPAEQPSLGNAGRIVVDSSGIGASGDSGGRISLWGGDISFVNNAVIYADNEGDSDATSAKGIDIHSYRLSVDKSLVAFDAYFGTGKAGSVSVSTQYFDIFNGGAISSSSLSGGDAGKVEVVADTLRIDRQSGSRQTGIASDAVEGSSGNAGSVAVSAKNLEILNGGTISSDTLSSGNAGTVQVVADTLRIDGQGGNRQTGIASDAAEGSSGNAGGVSVSAKNLDILNIGSISSNTWSTGDAGIVLVVADALRIDGQGNNSAGTGIFTGVYSTEQHSGKGGDLGVRAGTLDILNGGLISSSTFSEGNAGRIFVEADVLNIDNQGFLSWATGIVSKAEAGSSGHAGDLSIQAGMLNIVNGGLITSNTLSIGNAGTVQVAADTLRIDGQGKSGQTGIVSDAAEGSSGNAGGVSVSAKNLDILNIGSISSNTWSTGDAGIVQVVADTLRIDGQGGSRQTGIASDAVTGSSGNAGGVSVLAKSLDIRNIGTISSDTWSTGNAGAVLVVADKLRIDGQGNNSAGTGIFTGVYSTEQHSGKGGDLGVRAGTLDILNGGLISSSTFSEGNAGRIFVEADVLNIDNQGFLSWAAGIASKAESGSSGHAGDLSIQAGTLNIVNGGTISSDTSSIGNAGTVQVVADTLQIDGQGKSGQTGIASDAVTGSSGNAGGVSVSAKSLDIRNTGTISSDTWSTGNAGTVQVAADSLQIDGQDNDNAGTGIFSGVYTIEGSSGHAGNVIINAKDLKLTNKGTVSSNTLATGNAGILQIQADKIAIVNGANISSSTYAQGNAGSINVKADSVFIDGGSNSNQGGTGILSAANKGSSGNSGDINISADNISINRLGGIFAESEKGAGGRLELTAKRLELNDGGMITTTAFGSGQAGDIFIHGVHDISIDGSEDSVSFELDGVRVQGMASGIYLNSQGPGNGGSLNLQADRLTLSDGGVISALATVGKGGNIDIHSRTVDMTGGALISASTWGTGNAGVVNVKADDAISISGHFDRNLHSTMTNYRESEQSSISGNATRALISSTENLGAGGSVTVSAPLLTLADGGEINVSTEGVEKAGFVKIEAGTLAIAGSNSGISAEAKAGSGGQTGDVLVKASTSVRLSDNGKISIENAGNPDNPAAITPGSITITAPDIDMKNSEITSNSTGNVAAGNIVINFSHWLTMDPSFISTTANTGNGGSITINGGEAIYLQDSGFKTTVSGADSNGGDIFTTADILAMNTGVIQANAVGGSGGNITLSLDSLIPSGNTLIKGGSAMAWQPFEPGFNVIQAASQAGVSGMVNVTAPQLNLSGIIANLGGPQFDTSIIAQDYCGIGTGSSLTRKGAGGVKPKSGDQLLF